MSLNRLIKNMFITPDKKRELEDLYYKKMFPLGSKQQEFESNIIEKLFADKKNISSLKYVCLIRREMYIDQTINDKESEMAKEYRSTLKHMKITSEEEKIIDTLAKFIYEAKSLEDLKDIETKLLGAK